MDAIKCVMNSLADRLLIVSPFFLSPQCGSRTRWNSTPRRVRQFDGGISSGALIGPQSPCREGAAVRGANRVAEALHARSYPVQDMYYQPRQPMIDRAMF